MSKKITSKFLTTQNSHFLVILGRIRYYKEEQEEVKPHCWNRIQTSDSIFVYY